MNQGSDASASPEHQFWSTQPVVKGSEMTTPEGPLENRTVADVRQDPFPIASVLEWWVPDIMGTEDDLTQVYELLRDNYVEDDESMFRFNYSREFLKWALAPPGYIQNWHVGVRRKSDKKLVAFISGIPVDVQVKRASEPRDDETTPVGEVEHRKMCEINFLCIHKMLREKRLAPILIKEVTRRVNVLDMWQAVYTAGIKLPTPFASAQYFHRSLNPEKLVAIRFSRIPAQYEKFQNPMQMMKRTYAVAKSSVKGIRPMEAADVPAVCSMLRATLSRFHVAPVFSEDEVRHWFIPQEGVVYSYVVEDPKTKTVTDFVSFYSLPSTIIGHTRYTDLNAAYSYYYSANTISINALMNEALTFAKEKDFDVFNTLDILDNGKFLSDLKFGPGDGNLHYYFFNW
eukprot:CAMPEP_0176406110 /NCGR_PEP_ID=MMETSP0127-20121128/696_1 /TAXON_ID=938130 /ORGANISM="Platyophrya macrostoma, Strain WH" /LENGTH=399 /DNA_ID=CAMNT_0017785213 /DNA_START=66 /DNA_END=1262 /DNA_ORIENTATION=+